MTNDKTTQPAQADNKWRELALKFDGQRMAALAHLRTLLAHPEEHAEAVRKFLAEPPQAAPQPEAQPLHADPYTHVIQHLNSSPYNLTKDECIALVKRLRDSAAPSAQAEPQQADTVTLVGVKADGTEHVLGTATMPPKMKAKELVREMFGSIDEETGDDGAMALWVCEQLIEWMRETSLVVTLTNQAKQGGKA